MYLKFDLRSAAPSCRIIAANQILVCLVIAAKVLLPIALVGAIVGYSAFLLFLLPPIQYFIEPELEQFKLLSRPNDQVCDEITRSALEMIGRMKALNLSTRASELETYCKAVEQMGRNLVLGEVNVLSTRLNNAEVDVHFLEMSRISTIVSAPYIFSRQENDLGKPTFGL